MNMEHANNQEQLTIDEAYKQAIQHFSVARYNEADQLCTAIINAVPNHIDATNLLGIIALKVQRHDIAIKLFEKAINIDKSRSLIYYNLASSLYEIGREGEAKQALIIAHNLDPKNENIANSLYSMLDESFNKEAVNNVEQNIDQLLQQGILLHQSGEIEKAIKSYKKVLKIQPNNPSAFCNIGVALMHQGKFKNAVESFKKAISFKPDYAFAYSNLGAAQKELGDLTQAVLSYKKALAIQPEYAQAYSNLGLALKEQGDMDAGIKNLQKAVEIKPDYADARHNLSLMELVNGDFINGWKNYSWRWKIDQFDFKRYDKHKQKLWKGEDIANKRTLVWSEQGIGESIIFSSIIADLVKLKADVVLECDKRLIPLFSRSINSIKCVKKQDPKIINAQNNEFDFIVPEGDLCRWLRPDINSFPKSDAHLIADQKLKKSLRKKYQKKNKKLLVGISWNSKNSNHKNKSITLKQLRPLLGIKGVTFVNLQYGETKDELKESTKKTGVKIITDNTVDQMKDLDSFAAQIAAMDLVVTISNTTAHMAGALGVPTLLMLDKSPLWYWLLKGKNSPWYSSIRLFRQKKLGEWKDVITEVKQEVEKFAVQK
ncbi:MAG: tetratricopeptide repeat protein [Magnetococcales bacterium]|nr:tetratricopeptide repeat protein [Magnetococcales bacterium]